MRFISFMLAGFLLVMASGWETDFDNAKKQAEKEHKLILLNFSGSDWCIPCIRLRKEVFENTTFKTFADSNLVLLNAKGQVIKSWEGYPNLTAEQFTGLLKGFVNARK